jgi:hypothetical protein
MAAPPPVAVVFRAEAVLAAAPKPLAVVVSLVAAPLFGAPLPALRELARVLLRIDWLSAMFP